MTKDEVVPRHEPRLPSPELPWSSDALNHHPFSLQSDCPSSHIDPLSNDGGVGLPFGLGDENDTVISRILALESAEINSFHPMPSPVTIEAPFSTARSAMRSGGVEIETSSSISYFELPAALPGQCLQKETTKACQLQSAREEGIAPEKNTGKLNTEDFYTEVFADGFQDPADFERASPDEVRRIFRTSGCDLISKISQYWCQYAQLLKRMEETVIRLLDDRGVKIKRRKRMGPEVPASEKKEIRAQRNRERSQALRKHQKQRLSDLEGAGEKMRVYNSATRSLLNCVLEDEAALPLLHHYFTENDCSENLLAFLSNGD